jgi:hypothetical protein
MGALVCIRWYNEKAGSHEWAVYEKYYEQTKAPEKTGTEDLELCESEGMIKIARYPKLSTALFVELGKRWHTSLHIWQVGRWTTVPLEDATVRETHTLVDNDGTRHLLREGTGKMGPYEACDACSLRGKRCSALGVKCGAGDYYVSAPTA